MLASLHENIDAADDGDKIKGQRVQLRSDNSPCKLDSSLIDFICLFSLEYKTTITPSTPEMEMPLALAVMFLFHTLVFIYTGNG